jgi:hypothetical protein
MGPKHGRWKQGSQPSTTHWGPCLKKNAIRMKKARKPSGHRCEIGFQTRRPPAKPGIARRWTKLAPPGSDANHRNRTAA